MPVSSDGYVIGDVILFLPRAGNCLNLVGRPPVRELGAVPRTRPAGTTSKCERDQRSAPASRPIGTRKAYRFQVQGPNALKVMEKVLGATPPELKFFNMTDLTIAGKQCHALRHGMAGQPGCELFGPWERRPGGARGAGTKPVKELACVWSAGAPTRRTPWSRAGSRRRCRRSTRARRMKAYREWLPANGYEGWRVAGRLLRLRARSKTTTSRLWDLGYGPFMQVRSRLHRPRRAREEVDEAPHAQQGDPRPERRGRARRRSAAQYRQGQRARQVLRLPVGVSTPCIRTTR